MRPLSTLLLAIATASVSLALAACTGDDDVTPGTGADASVDNNQPPPPPPPADGGDGGGTCLELSDFVLDIVRNKTADNNKPETIDDKVFCTPDKEDPKLYNALFP